MHEKSSLKYIFSGFRGYDLISKTIALCASSTRGQLIKSDNFIFRDVYIYVQLTQLENIIIGCATLLKVHLY